MTTDELLSPAPAKRLSSSAFRRLFSLTALLLACCTLDAETNTPPAAPSHVARAMKALAAARSRFNTESNNVEAAWELGRACFDLADMAADDTSKADMANQGIAACRTALALNSNSAPAHYYLGMSIGELADTKRNLSALRMVKDMEREFLIARNLDEHFDFGGADRNLGLLYDQAPSFASIGSRVKSRQYLQRAVEIAPDFPENRLNFIEACLRWKDRNSAAIALNKLEDLWPDAQKKFSGSDWDGDWVGWERRLNAVKTKLGEAPKTLDSPRNSD